MESPFTSDENEIFENKEPFDDEFTPDEILERDDVIKEYTRALQDVVDGFGPQNIFVYGESGLGKTALTEKMMELLQEEIDQKDTNLTVININCNKKDSTYHVIRYLANTLSDKTYTQGHHHDKFWSVIYDEIDKIGGEFIIILDEIDHLGTDDTLLYEFPRARAMGELENARVGVIGICNNFLYRDNLRDRVKNTLCEREIQFSPYNASELRTILWYYAGLAFKNDALSDDVIPLTAAVTAQETGDARSGLDLLEESGNIARDGGAGKVTEEHVMQARIEVERAKVKDIFIDDLTRQQQILFLAILALDVTKDSEIGFDQVFNQYKLYCDTVGTDEKTKRRVRDFVGVLEQKGFVQGDMHNVGGRGGRWKSYTVIVAPTAVIDAADNEGEQFTGLITDEIRDAADDAEREGTVEVNFGNY